MASLNFNANEIPEDNRSFEPLPVGDYNMQVIESEVRATKRGNGEQLVLTLEVLDGPYAGRRVWDRLNIRNPNSDAQRIAERALADLCLAINVMHITDSANLHYKPFIGYLTIRPANDKYGPENNVRYKPRVKAAPAAQPVTQPAAQPTVQPAPRSTAARPWQRAS
jgi:hypothetical protein